MRWRHNSASGSVTIRPTRIKTSSFRGEQMPAACVMYPVHDMEEPGMIKGMRNYGIGMAAAAALFLFPVSAFSQSIEIGPGGVRFGSGQCEELRRACENKDALGERGEGNCRRYRESCQRPARRDVCGELREACLNKDRLGEQGEGNCRRYRQTCRGRL